jgi:hypothetical protein
VQIKIDYKLIVSTTCKSTYVVCSRWPINKYSQIIMYVVLTTNLQPTFISHAYDLFTQIIKSSVKKKTMKEIVTYDLWWCF